MKSKTTIDKPGKIGKGKGGRGNKEQLGSSKSRNEGIFEVQRDQSRNR